MRLTGLGIYANTNNVIGSPFQANQKLVKYGETLHTGLDFFAKPTETILSAAICQREKYEFCVISCTSAVKKYLVLTATANMQLQLVILDLTTSRFSFTMSH